jgi:hypothetical protein
LVEGDAGDRSLLATGLATGGDRSGDFLKKEKNRHKLRKTKIPGGFNELPFSTSSLHLITIYSAMRFLHLKLVCCG